MVIPLVIPAVVRGFRISAICKLIAVPSVTAAFAKQLVTVSVPEAVSTTQVSGFSILAIAVHVKEAVFDIKLNY